MGQVHVPPKAVLFSGILYSKGMDEAGIFSRLEEIFGKIILTSSLFPFTETDYYSREMGSELMRRWLAFDRLIEMEEIVDMKLLSNGIELQYRHPNGSRSLNIDPGYLNEGKVVLATTKNNQHRIYLKKGIYAEVTLRYRSKRYMPWEWTFRDYRREEAASFFIELRKIYRSKISKSCNFSN